MRTAPADLVSDIRTRSTSTRPVKDDDHWAYVVGGAGATLGLLPILASVLRIPVAVGTPHVTRHGKSMSADELAMAAAQHPRLPWVWRWGRHDSLRQRSTTSRRREVKIPLGPPRQRSGFSAAGGLHQILGPRNFPALNSCHRPSCGVQWALPTTVLLAGDRPGRTHAVVVRFARMQLSQAQNQLAVAQQSLREAEAAKAEYDDVPTVYAAVDAARAELSQAMGNEVQVARIISDLAGILPLDVSLSTVSLVAGLGQPATNATTDEVLEPWSAPCRSRGGAQFRRRVDLDRNARGPALSERDPDRGVTRSSRRVLTPSVTLPNSPSRRCRGRYVEATQ